MSLQEVALFLLFSSLSIVTIALLMLPPIFNQSFSTLRSTQPFNFALQVLLAICAIDFHRPFLLECAIEPY